MGDVPNPGMGVTRVMVERVELHHLHAGVRGSDDVGAR